MSRALSSETRYLISSHVASGFLLPFAMNQVPLNTVGLLSFWRGSGATPHLNVASTRFLYVPGMRAVVMAILPVANTPPLGGVSALVSSAVGATWSVLIRSACAWIAAATAGDSNWVRLA